MKKVVIIAYNFPPVGGAGVQRPVKFVKYLKEFGWQPVVLTVKNPSVPVIDTSLLRNIPQDVVVYTAKTLEPSYTTKNGFAKDGNRIKAACKKVLKNVISSILLPDLQVLWWPALVAKLITVIKAEKPDCLFVTAPPFSSFLPVIVVGSFLKVPVIVDFRDEWSFSRNTWEHSTKHRLASTLDNLFEKYVIHKCSAFTAANMSYIESIHETHHDIDRDKGFVITNGYDEDDFGRVTADSLRISAKDKINIVYAGTVWKGNSLSPFISALNSLIREDASVVDKLNVKIYGRVVDTEKFYFRNVESTKIVNLLDYCDHDTIVSEISQADILLLCISDVPGAHKIILGKVFEYMATGKHILAIIPDGETKRIIANNYSNSSIVHPEELDTIRNALRTLINNIAHTREHAGNDVSQFSRRRLTGRLAEVLEFADGK